MSKHRIYFSILGFFALLGVCSAQGREKVVVMEGMDRIDKSVASSMAIGQKAILNEKLAWEKFKEKDVKGFDKLMADDLVDFDAAGGIYTKPALLELIPDYEVTDYSLEHFKAIVLDENSAIVIYKATVIGTYKGERLTAKPMNVSSTWIKRHGDWQIVFHQETFLTSQQ